MRFLTLFCTTQLAGIGLENSLENRQSLRELLFTTSSIEEYISGVVSKRIFRLRSDTYVKKPILTSV